MVAEKLFVVWMFVHWGEFYADLWECQEGGRVRRTSVFGYCRYTEKVYSVDESAKGGPHSGIICDALETEAGVMEVRSGCKSC